MLGRPYALMLTAGNVSDVKAAPALLERAGRMRYLLGDKGYDANSLRKTLRDLGTSPVIPGRRNRKRAIRYDQQRYRGRHLIENAFCRIKDFRRVATRYDKLAAAHQQLKEELGLDHFEGRSWQGLHRHALMSMIAFAFLQARRLRAAGRKKKKPEPATAADPACHQAGDPDPAQPASAANMPALP